MKDTKLENLVEWQNNDITNVNLEEKADIIVASYMLNELKDSEKLEILKKLWENTNQILFIIEPGTPESYKNIFVSVFPILAFWKAYFDWVLPSRFLKEYPYSIQGFMEERLSQGNFSFVWNSVETVQNMVKYFGRIPLAFYDNDIYTSAWLNPFSPDLSRTSITIPNEIDFGNNQHMDGVTTDSINSKCINSSIRCSIIGRNTSTSQFTINRISSNTIHMLIITKVYFVRNSN